MILALFVGFILRPKNGHQTGCQKVKPDCWASPFGGPVLRPFIGRKNGATPFIQVLRAQRALGEHAVFSCVIVSQVQVIFFLINGAFLWTASRMQA